MSQLQASVPRPNSDLKKSPMTPAEQACLNFSSRWSRIPQAKPRAALEPVRDTAAQTIITKDDSLLPMSLEAMASSTPEKSRSTPKSPMGNCPKILTNELPNIRPSNSFPVPRNSTEAPLLPPHRYCPASPPAPWQTGMAPNQHPTRFIAPTLAETAVADTSLSGNMSDDSLQTAMTELSTDSGICGTAALRNPIFQSSFEIFTT